MLAIAPLPSRPTDGTGLEHFARTVSPRHWKEVLIQMLTVCFDGSGKEDTRCMVVAGFCSFATAWTDFENQWQKRLRQDGLPYFHAVDFAHSRGVFSDDWKDNKAKREVLVTDLLNIIRSNGLTKFGRIMRPGDFQEALSRLGPNSTLDAFAFTAMKVVEDFHAYARNQGVRRNVRYVFEKGDPEDHLRALFRGHGFADPDFAWARPHTDRKGFAHDPFVGLQAADWLAYEYYLDVDRLMYSNPTNRKPFQVFESLPGSVILQYHGSVLPGIPNVRMRSTTTGPSSSHKKAARKKKKSAD